MPITLVLIKIFTIRKKILEAVNGLYMVILTFRYGQWRLSAQIWSLLNFLRVYLGIFLEILRPFSILESTEAGLVFWTLKPSPGLTLTVQNTKKCTQKLHLSQSLDCQLQISHFPQTYTVNFILCPSVQN